MGSVLTDEKIDQLRLLARTQNQVVLSGSNLALLLLRLDTVQTEVRRLQAELDGYQLR